MSEFIPEKLFVEYKDNTSVNKNKEGRKYTLTHSDETGDLFLTIGKDYDYEKTNETRDEVLAEWKVVDGKNILSIYIQVSLDASLTKTIVRDKIFREELPLALRAIIYGDKEFLRENLDLYKSKIIINFKSDISKYNNIEDWGIVSDYFSEDNNYKRNIDRVYMKDNKNNYIEEALIRVLSLYIKNQVNIFWGREAIYCLNDAEVLYSKKIDKAEYLPEELEIRIGLKIGSITPLYNNFIITFLIKDNVINIKDSKRNDIYNNTSRKN